MYLCIENQGVVPIEAFTMFVTDKREATDKIGYFGSGANYSLAWLVRNSAAPVIYAGDKQLPITTEQFDFKGQIKTAILIDGQRTSLTTDMGPKWKDWYALRELVCNAFDEGGMSVFLTDLPISKSGCTRIFLDAELFGELWNKKHRYFKLWSTPAAAVPALGRVTDRYNTSVNFYTASPKHICIYRKGILVYEKEDQESIFHYDLGEVEINESREASSDYELRHAIGNGILRLTDKALIRKIIQDGNPKSFEDNLARSSHVTISDEWVEVLQSLGGVIAPHDMTLLVGNQYDKIVPLWTWLYLAARERLHQLSFDREGDWVNEEACTEFNKQHVIRLFKKFGFEVESITKADLFSGKKLVLKGNQLVINRTSITWMDGELAVFKAFISTYYTSGAFIDHLLITL